MIARIWYFARKDLIDRYQGDLLGVAWLLLQPLVTILLFAVVFTQLMRARLPGLDPSFGYTLYLISGILVWNAFSSCLSRLSGWYRDQAGLYRKIALGLYAPAFSVVLSEFVVLLLSLGLFALFAVVIGHPLHLAFLIAPVLGLALMGLAYGLGLMLGLLEVFLPDVRRAVPLLLQLAFWLTPIVYTRDILPTELQSLLDWSPPALLIGAVQQAVLYGQWPSLSLWGLWLLLAGILGTGLLLLGRRLRKALRDAL